MMRRYSGLQKGWILLILYLEILLRRRCWDYRPNQSDCELVGSLGSAADSSPSRWYRCYETENHQHRRLPLPFHHSLSLSQCYCLLLVRICCETEAGKVGERAKVSEKLRTYQHNNARDRQWAYEKQMSSVWALDVWRQASEGLKARPSMDAPLLKLQVLLENANPAKCFDPHGSSFLQTTVSVPIL